MKMKNHLDDSVNTCDENWMPGALSINSIYKKITK